MGRVKQMLLRMTNECNDYQDMGRDISPLIELSAETCNRMDTFRTSICKRQVAKEDSDAYYTEPFYISSETLCDQFLEVMDKIYEEKPPNLFKSHSAPELQNSTQSDLFHPATFQQKRAVQSWFSEYWRHLLLINLIVTLKFAIQIMETVRHVHQLQ
ncbi:hypothetical protein BC833DRAFT_611023 [Globomyces pollinis-pini]|nr:hypothetical protein BC833DRAFT_611023 [Globomyces pollinis-pini]